MFNNQIVLAAWTQRWKILVVFFLVMAAAIAAVLVLPPTFEAKSTLLVKESRAQIGLGTAENKESSFRTSEEVINSEVAILQSSHLRAKVIETLGPEVFRIESTPPTSFFAKLRAAVIGSLLGVVQYGKYLLIRIGLLDSSSPLEEALTLLETGLLITPLRKADVIELSLRSRNPVAAANVLNTLVSLYLERHNELHQTSGAYEFFKTQTLQLRQQLEGAEQELRAFQKQHSLVSLEEQRRLLLGQIAEVTTELERSRREDAELTARIQKVKSDLHAVAENVKLSETRQRNPLLDTLESRLLELRQQREKLLARFLPESRPIQDLDGETQRIQELLAASKADVISSTTSGQNTTYRELEKALLTDEARQIALRASQNVREDALRSYQARLQELVDQEFRLRQLTREVEDNQFAYQTYRKGLEERRIEVEMDRQRIVKVSVIDLATVPRHPIRPRKLLTVIMAIPMGLLLGGLVAFTAENYDRLLGYHETASAVSEVAVLDPSPVVKKTPSISPENVRS